ncbi:MAG: RnfABCDGE type electron transport complex subunit D [Granulosicoccaceae bacterium]
MSLVLHSSKSLTNVMLLVIIALVPGIAAYAWLVSPIVIINIVFCVLIACLTEAACMWLRSRSAVSALRDGSIILAATLLALAVPPQLPFWQLGLGAVAMVVLGKQLYGGLGQNLFNPAMVGFAFLMVSFPQTMTTWIDNMQQSVGMAQLVQAKWFMPSNIQWDSITQATPLESIRLASQYGADQATPLTQAALNRQVTNGPWPIVNLGFLVGGLCLLYKRIISWHIPLSVIFTLFALHGILALTSTQPQIGATLAIASGATMLGAFFIATDPVTAATSNTGRIIYGIGIGGLSFVIRQWGGYPEGFAFAVLLMNMCAPLIDSTVNRHA